jgi:hypothetical protein
MSFSEQIKKLKEQNQKIDTTNVEEEKESDDILDVIADSIGSVVEAVVEVDGLCTNFWCKAIYKKKIDDPSIICPKCVSMSEDVSGGVINNGNYVFKSDKKNNKKNIPENYKLKIDNLSDKYFKF